MDAIQSLADAIKGLTAAQAQKAAELAKTPEPAPVQEIGIAKALLESGAEGGSRGMKKPESLIRAEQSTGNKAIALGKVLRAAAYSMNKRHDHSAEGAARVIHDVYRDKEFSKWYIDGIAKDLTAGTPSGGGYLIGEQMMDDIVEVLRAQAVLFKLGMREVPMPSGNLRLPRITAGASASYVSESTAPNATDVTFGDALFSAKKLIAIVPISNDLLMVPSVAADQIVAMDATASLSTTIDNKGFNGDGTSDTPRGLRYLTGLTVTTISGAITADNITQFIADLLNANVALSSAARLGWAMGPDVWMDLYNLKATTNQYLFRDEMNTGKLLGYPFEITSAISVVSTATQLYFGDFSEFIIARQGMMEVDASPYAAYNNSSGTVVAAYSKDQTVLRIIDRHDFNMRQAAAMARSTGLTS